MNSVSCVVAVRHTNASSPGSQPKSSPRSFAPGQKPATFAATKNPSRSESNPADIDENPEKNNAKHAHESSETVNQSCTQLDVPKTRIAEAMNERRNGSASSRQSSTSPRKMSVRHNNFRLSPLASALIQQKTGIFLPPTHITTPTKSTRVLSPACSPAMREYFQQGESVQVPDLSKPYRHHTESNRVATPGLGAEPLPSRHKSTTMVRTSAISDSSESVRRPFLPAMFDTRTGASVTLNAKYISTQSTVKETPVFIPLVPRVMVHKRAVIIGISYKYSKFQRYSPAHGEAAEHWFHLLVSHLEFLTEEIWVLTDVPFSSVGKATVTPPTHENIKKALSWLTVGVTAGDRLFFSYNGDVAYEKSQQKDPTCPTYHALVPSDYPSSPGIWDEEFHDMVKHLPQDVSMTMFLDCRMSWNLVRLPHVYLPFKYSKNAQFELCRALTAESPELPHLASSFSHLLRPSFSQSAGKNHEVTAKHMAYFESYAKAFSSAGNVVCFAASPVKYSRFRRYKTFGINWLSKGAYTCAAISAIESLVSRGVWPSYRQLMFNLAELLSPPGVLFQVPQVCATRDIDLNQTIPL